MDGQISLFDFLNPERFDPLKALVKRGSVYWTHSRQLIIDSVDKDINEFTRIVKHEYCPYGYAGAYIHNRTPNKIDEFTFRDDRIDIEWTDEGGIYRKGKFTYKAFARAVKEAIIAGTYKEDNK